jgi:hypothetical protein
VVEAADTRSEGVDQDTAYPDSSVTSTIPPTRRHAAYTPVVPPAGGITELKQNQKGMGDDMMTDEERETWLAIRKDAGLKIDPETAEVHWHWGQSLDPYGVGPKLPEELQQVGREYFARSPGSDVWVNFEDLSEAVVDRLWERMKAGDFDDREDDLPF